MSVPPPPRSVSRPFLDWLDDWYASLPDTQLAEIIQAAGGADNVAILVVDLLVGFCTEGPLAGPRVAALGPKTADFLTATRIAGVRTVALAMDAHPQDSREFAAFPPHCIRGTREAELIAELAELPFSDEMVRFPKGSLNVGLETGFNSWLEEQPHLRAWIILGDCTDLCVYQTATYLRLRANTRGLDLSVWTPADLTDTYDLPVEQAVPLGAMPHDGGLLHRVFLYHLALNGVRVVASIRPVGP